MFVVETNICKGRFKGKVMNSNLDSFLMNSDYDSKIFLETLLKLGKVTLEDLEDVKDKLDFEILFSNE